MGLLFEVYPLTDAFAVAAVVECVPCDARLPPANAHLLSCGGE